MVLSIPLRMTLCVPIQTRRAILRAAALAAIAVPVACTQVTAQATTGALRAVIHLEGVKPNRVVYFANLDMLSSRIDPFERLAALQHVQRTEPRLSSKQRIERAEEIVNANRTVEVNVTEIRESPDGPFGREIVAIINCGNKAVSNRLDLVFYHHNGKHEYGPPAARTASLPWEVKAMLVGCAEERWRTAIQADVRRGSGQTDLIKLGMALAGRWGYLAAADAYDFAWDKLWRDGKKRDITTDRSPGEIEALRKRIIGQMESAGRIADGALGAAEGAIKAEDSERAFIGQVAANFTTKNDLQRRSMFAQQGWSEQEVIAFWGAPERISNVGGSRVLVYSSEADERQTTAFVDKTSGAVVATETTGQLRQCQLSLFMRDGGRIPGPRLWDFQMTGQNCNISTLVKNRPKR